MAVADSSKYCIVNLLDQNMYEVLPIAQVDPAEIGIEGSLEVNIAVIPGEEEFLCTSFAGSGTIGVFVNKEGDPVKGTITWQSHPKSIGMSVKRFVNLKYLIDVMRNSSSQLSRATLWSRCYEMTRSPSTRCLSLPVGQVADCCRRSLCLWAQIHCI
jgi:hypothetical protein